MLLKVYEAALFNSAKSALDQRHIRRQYLMGLLYNSVVDIIWALGEGWFGEPLDDVADQDGGQFYFLVTTVQVISTLKSKEQRHVFHRPKYVLD